VVDEIQVNDDARRPAELDASTYNPQVIAARERVSTTRRPDLCVPDTRLRSCGAFVFVDEAA